MKEMDKFNKSHNKKDDIALDRFIIKHNEKYDIALKEIKEGEKKTCWIWYILPIMKGLRKSENSLYYGIKDFEEATQYLKNELLYSHLIEICQTLLDLKKEDIFDVMGYIDGIKLQQCMTLFNEVEEKMNINCNNIFKKILSKYYNGEKDIKTLEILKDLKK